MFTTLAAFSRTARKLVFPLGRTAIALLVWLNRYTLMLWFRSVRDEVQENGVDPERLRYLARGLWAIANDRRIANAEPLKTLWVRTDRYEFAAHEDWAGRDAVEEVLGPIGPHETTVVAA